MDPALTLRVVVASLDASMPEAACMCTCMCTVHTCIHVHMHVSEHSQTTVSTHCILTNRSDRLASGAIWMSHFLDSFREDVQEHVHLRGPSRSNQAIPTVEL